MSSFSSNGILGEASNKRPLENGHVSVPKYKPRKVSATRDFPPGCGRNVPPIDLKPEENEGTVAAILEAGGVNDIETADVVICNGVRISERDENLKISTVMEVDKVNTPAKPNSVNLDGIMNPETVKIEDPSNIEDWWSHGAINSPNDFDMAESLDVLVSKVTTSVTMDFSAVDDLMMEIPIGVNEFGWQTHEAVDKPVELERAEPVDTMVGEVTTATVKTDGSSNGVDESITVSERTVDALGQNTGVEEAKPVSNAGASVNDLLSPGSSHPPLSLARPKDKYRRRRVSAVRDFPIGCGRNAPPIQIEQLVVTSADNSLDSVEKVEVKPETDTSQRTEPIDVFPKVDVKTETTETIQEKLSSFKECDGNVQDRKSEKMESERALSSEVLDNRNEDRQVVRGLMAGPYCPWRKLKVPLNNSSGGTRDQNSSRKQHKSKAVCSNHDTYDEPVCAITPISMYDPTLDKSDEDTGSESENKMVVYSPGKSDVKPLRSVSYADEPNKTQTTKKLVSKKSVAESSSSAGKIVKKPVVSSLHKSTIVAKKSTPTVNSSGRSLKKKKPRLSEDTMVIDEKELELQTNFNKKQEFDVNLPPFGPNSSARNKVRETLRLFHTICRKLVQKEEAKLTTDIEEGTTSKKLVRFDLATAGIIKEKGKEVNTGKQILGHVPGVEVGDEFQYRVELAVVGIHRLYQNGIDSMKHNGKLVATSIVASGAYADDLEETDVLKYSGQGGNVVGKKKNPEDQKLERGNLALKNSIDMKTPVRVVRGWRDMKVVDFSDSKSKPKLVTTYVYDGIYHVTKYWTQNGPHGKSVFMFELRRDPGQPELAWKELKKSNKSKTRPGVCVKDISGGKESFPIWAVNLIDDQKPPPFNYIRKMKYPDWYTPLPPKGCGCTTRCSDSRKCQCAVKNGGEIPYNRNGAIVEIKPLVYECGPNCKCPPSCYNRVTQRGIKFQLEIFKTGSRGWGIRSTSSVPSGSFICEYAGELLEDREAERRVGSDEYLFDIGQNFNDQKILSESVEEGEVDEEGEGFTIDAAEYGNVGRFINHSCSPNLYAQNVIYDHDDKKMPHVMLFAAENIPPLQELTYHYNYTVGQVRDSNGNVKVKKCYCGSSECTGRMY